MQTTRLALLVSAALAAPAAPAAIDNYAINLKRDTSLDIAATATAGPVASVQVVNRTSSRVRCFVDFEGGRLTPTRREAWMDAGTVATVRQAINDPQIATLDVGLTCDTLSPDEPIPPANAPGTAIIRGTNASTGTGTPGTGTTGTTGTAGTTTASGTSARNTRATTAQTAAEQSRTTRNTGTATVISPNPAGSAAGTSNRATP